MNNDNDLNLRLHHQMSGWLRYWSVHWPPFWFYASVINIPHTASDATDLLQVVNSTGFVATCQRVATNLSISSSCNKSVTIRLIAICHLQTCYNLLKQLETSLLIKSLDNQLATSLLTINLQLANNNFRRSTLQQVCFFTYLTSLLTTCNRTVVNKLSQAMRTHPDIGLL